MKKYVLVTVLTLLYSIVSAADLSIEKQEALINSYMYITGQVSHDKAASAADDLGSSLPHKCGMPVVREFLSYYDKFDRSLLKSSGVQIQDRPVLTDSLASPSGRFLIHYNVSGDSAVYTGVSGGAMGYVDSVARIMDDVYDYTVNVLGYPAPPVDSFYPEGGDEKYDVYLVDISFYGLAYPDFEYETVGGDSLATAFLEFDNDYAELSQYRDRPLDAVRVTAAHEFFHMVQFGIDYRESEVVSNAVEGPAWMEMSAVWMEEEQYDDINDYYYYLPYFFDDPRASIQQFTGGGDLHPYASGIFPIFLTEKYDRDIIKAIWLKCGEYGPGPDFLEVVEEVVDSISGGLESYESNFRDFALWNYFTSDRASRAPVGVGYSEREFYEEEFSDDPFDGEIRVDFDFPFLVQGNDNGAFNPDHNGAFYLSLIDLQKVAPIYRCLDSIPAFDTTYWVCNSGAFPSCDDSTEVTSSDAYDTLYIDTFACTDSIPTLRFFFGLDPAFSNNWGLSVIYRYNQYLDSVVIDSLIIPEGVALGFDVVDPVQYRSVTFVFTPASSNRNFYAPPADYYVATGVSNSINADSVDANLPGVAFYPYPNPAVVENMADPTIKFKFQVPTDSSGFPITINTSDPYLVVDLFSISGERIKTFDELSVVLTDIFEGEYVAEWDMKNEAGKDVASGVYLAYARLYTDSKKNELLIENKTKIAIIR